MADITLSIFVPCFNEERNIINTLNNIKQSVQNISYEILVADDCSTDQSVKIINEFKNNNPNLNIRIFCNKINRGLGFNYHAMALKALGKYYMIVNGDAVEPPHTIKKIIDNIGKADMVITYFGKNDKRKLVRKIISKIFVLIINLITFNNLHYYNGPALHLLDNVKLYGAGSYGFGYQAELITSMINEKITYIEVQIENIDRPWGATKAFTLHNILSVGLSIFRIFLNQLTYIMKKILK